MPKIILNGKPLHIGRDVLDYDDVRTATGMEHPTVTYRKGAVPEASGTLRPLQTIRACDGMIVNATNTSAT